MKVVGANLLLISIFFTTPLRIATAFMTNNYWTTGTWMQKFHETNVAISMFEIHKMYALYQGF
jgi:hypothetical protein